MCLGNGDSELVRVANKCQIYLEAHSTRLSSCLTSKHYMDDQEPETE